MLTAFKAISHPLRTGLIYISPHEKTSGNDLFDLPKCEFGTQIHTFHQLRQYYKPATLFIYTRKTTTHLH